MPWIYLLGVFVCTYGGKTVTVSLPGAAWHIQSLTPWVCRQPSKGYGLSTRGESINFKEGHGDTYNRGAWRHSYFMEANFIEDNVIVRATLGLDLLFSRNNLVKNNGFVDCP